VNELPPEVNEARVNRAIITDGDDGSFVVEYDNTIGTKNTMRLEATTYEEAVAEIKTFLGITGDRDEAGNVWEID
jgi:hypothetical protein